MRTLLVQIVFGTGAALAATNPIIGMAPPPTLKDQLIVRLDISVVPDPSVLTLQGGWNGRWVVNSIARDDSNRLVALSHDVVGVAVGQNYQSEQFVSLSLDPPLPPPTRLVQFKVELLLGTNFGSFTYTTPSSGRTGTKWAFLPSTKKDADSVLSGIYAPGVGSAPIYTVDSKLIFRRAIQTRRTLIGYWGVRGEAKTESRRTLDPNSFRAAVTFDRRVQRRVNTNFLRQTRFQWDVFAAELGRSKKEPDPATYNLLTAPALATSFWGTDWAVVRVQAGPELGVNRRNVLQDTGSGGVARGSLNIQGIVGRDKLWGDVGLTISSEYQLRALLLAEIYTPTRRGVILPSSLSKRARPYVKNSLDFKFGPMVLTFSHEWGVAPPTFQFVGHKGTVALSFFLKQNLPVR